MSVVLKKTALTKELLAELRNLEQHAMPHRGEEILSVMNVDGRWYCMKGSELIAQLQLLPSQVQLSDHMVRNLRSPHTQRRFKRITFTPKAGTGAERTDMSILSRIEFAFGTFVHGFTFVMPEEVWTRLKPQVLQHIEFCETEFGKHTRFDMLGRASNKKKAKGNKSRKA